MIYIRYIYIYIYIYIYMCVCVCVCVCVCACGVCVCMCVCVYAYVCVYSIPHELSTCLIAKTLFLPVSIFCRTMYAVPIPPLPSCFNTSYLSISKTLLQHVEQTLSKNGTHAQKEMFSVLFLFHHRSALDTQGISCSSSLLSLM